MTTSEIARQIVELTDSIGVGRDDMYLWECNLNTAITAALDAERAKVKMLREALGHYSGPAFSGMMAREALSKLEDV